MPKKVTVRVALVNAEEAKPGSAYIVKMPDFGSDTPIMAKQIAEQLSDVYEKTGVTFIVLPHNFEVIKPSDLSECTKAVREYIQNSDVARA